MEYSDNKINKNVICSAVRKYLHRVVKKYNPDITSNSEYDWTPVKYLNVLHHNRTQKRLPHKNILLHM